MSKEAMKLALEALEDTLSDDPYPYSLESKAITALREALAKPDFWEGYVPEPVKPAQQKPLFKPLIDLHPGLDEELKAVDAPAQQEPVAWMDEFGNTFPLGAQRGPKYLNEPMKPLYTSPPARHGWTTEQITGMARLKEAQDKKLSQRTWVSLTDEQMFEMAEIAWRHGWASCRDADYVGEEAEDERWGMVGAEVVQDIAAHNIKENT